MRGAEAIGLASQGAKVVVNDLGCEGDGTGASKSPADKVVEEIERNGLTAIHNYDNIITLEGAENIVKTAVERFGRINILVNNAGIIRDCMIFYMSPEERDAVIEVYLYGTFYCAQIACIHMQEQGYGRIINTSSHLVLVNMRQANYYAAKGKGSWDSPGLWLEIWGDRGSHAML